MIVRAARDQAKSHMWLGSRGLARPGLEIPYIGYALMDFEIKGLQFPACGVVIVKDECSSNPLIIGINVIKTCWELLFQNQERPMSLTCQNPSSQQIWRSAFASCRRIVAGPGMDFSGISAQATDEGSLSRPEVKLLYGAGPPQAPLAGPTMACWKPYRNPVLSE